MTATVKYHINNNSEVKICKATLFPCKFTEHYFDMKEAETKAEEILHEQHQLLAKIEKFDNLAKVKKIEGILDQEKFDNLDEETRRIIISSIKKLDNNNKEQELWQAIYDSTPSGQLALNRIRTSNKKKRLDLAKLAGSIKLDKNNPEQNINIQDYDTNIDSNSFTQIDKNISVQDKDKIDEATKKMTLLSATWMSNLSSDEIDSVNWITGHGAGILNKHLIGEEHPSAHQYSKEFLDKKAEAFQSAMKKAPEVDEPVVFYRGTKYRHVIQEELKNVASSSYGNDIAQNFAKNKPNAVIMEIKTKKIPSVVAMSEWGTTELEILAPLGKYKKIGEFTTPDNIQVVQLEYVGE